MYARILPRYTRVVWMCTRGAAIHGTGTLNRQPPSDTPVYWMDTASTQHSCYSYVCVRWIFNTSASSCFRVLHKSHTTYLCSHLYRTSILSLEYSALRHVYGQSADVPYAIALAGPVAGFELHCFCLGSILCYQDIILGRVAASLARRHTPPVHDTIFVNERRL